MSINPQNNSDLNQGVSHLLSEFGGSIGGDKHKIGQILTLNLNFKFNEPQKQ